MPAMTRFTRDESSCHSLRWIAVFALLITAASGAVAREAPEATADGGGDQASLSTDPLLTARFREGQAGGELADFLESLSATTGAQISADRKLGQQGLTCVGMDAEAARIMRAVARTYHSTWARRAGAKVQYYLHQSQSDRDARKQAYAKARSNGLARARARWNSVRKLAYASDSELRMRAQRGEAMARCLLHPRGRAMARLVFGLSPAWIEQLWRKGSIRIDLEQLPDHLKRLAQAARGSGSAISVVDRDTGQPLTLDQDGSGYLRVALGGTADRPTVMATVMYGFTGTTANLLYAEGMVRQPPEERRAERQRRRLQLPANHPLLRTVTLREPADRSGLERGERPRLAKPMAKFLLECHRR